MNELFRFWQSLRFKKTNIVNVAGFTFYINTADTLDKGFETMVFQIKKHVDDATEIGINRLFDSGELKEEDIIFKDFFYTKHYTSKEEAAKGHEKVVNLFLDMENALHDEIIKDFKPDTLFGKALFKVGD